MTRETRGKGGLGLGAGDSRQERYDMCIVQIKSKKEVQVCIWSYILEGKSAK